MKKLRTCGHAMLHRVRMGSVGNDILYLELNSWQIPTEALGMIADQVFGNSSSGT